MDAIRLVDANQLYVVVGGQIAANRLLDLAARLALRGPLLLLDCGNCANPLPLARKLHQLTHDPVGVLRQVHLARAFTCYQVAALLERTVTDYPQQPVLIFNALSTFYDESVQYGEGRRLLEHCLKLINRINAAAPVVVSAKLPPPEYPERAHFVELLCAAADQLWVEETSATPAPLQPNLFI